MKIQKIKKLYDEVHNYCYIHKMQLGDWELQVSQYDNPGKYSNIVNYGKISPGVKWGKTGDTGFFYKVINVPNEYQGYGLYLEMISGGEAQVFIGERAYQGNDPNHYRVLLTECASGYEKYDITVESYVRMSQNAVGEYTYDKACTGEFIQSHLCAVDLEAQEFIRDLNFAIELAETHTEYQPLIENMLTHIFTAFDITEQESFLDYVKEGQGYLAQQLDSIPAMNNMHVLWMIGQSHLDLAWFWRKSETYRKVVRTFSSALRNMEHEEHFRFMMPQVKLYKMIKEKDREIFDAIKQRVDEDRWEIAGQMYLEPDTNLLSGEWLVRQILFGRKFYQKEFGKVPQVESLIDAFGYSGNIPQILKKSGIKGVMVTKMMWYNDTNQFPYTAFKWKGIDGTGIIASTMPWFNRGCSPKDARENLEKNLQPQLVENIPVFYGWGDGGGGPDENHLAGLKRLMKWYKPAKVVSGSLWGYFSYLETIENKLPQWWGEIYQEGHRGCYTSQARNKKYNGQAEELYRAIEFLMGFEWALGGENQYSVLEDSIELILINQFHDILPGSAATKVYEDSYKDYEKIFECGERNKKRLLAKISSRINCEGAVPIVIWNFNSVSKPAIVRIEWNDSCEGKVLDQKGDKVPYCIENGIMSFIVTELPAFGYQVYRFVNGDKQVLLSDSHTEKYIQNERYLVQWNEEGALNRIYDKLYDRELLTEKGLGNQLKLYFDYPNQCDAWDIDADYKDKSYVLCAQEIGSPMENDIKQWVTMHYRFGKSTITQSIILYKGIERIDFETKVQWNEKHKLLKSLFEVAVDAFKATYDIPFGVIERDVHFNNSNQKAMFEVPALSFADLSEGNYGVALMSAMKYGFSIQDNIMSISLLRAPTFPDAAADQGEHIFSYSLFGHKNGFREGEVVHQAKMLSNPIIAEVATPGNGNLPTTMSFISTDSRNVIIDTLKSSESGAGLILRVYESYGQRNKVKLNIQLPVNKVEECNLVEEVIRDITIENGLLEFEIKPFEIKTFILYRVYKDVE